MYRIGSKDYTDKEIIKLAAEHEKMGIPSGAIAIANSLKKPKTPPAAKADKE